MAAGRSINDIADAILAKQLQRKDLEAAAEACKKEETALKAELEVAAAAESLTLGGGKNSKWKIETDIVPSVTNWDEFYAYIAKMKYFHLLQRRASTKSCQELWGQGKKVPGVDKFSKNVVTVKEK